jgi:hypothetical protein
MNDSMEYRRADSQTSEDGPVLRLDGWKMLAGADGERFISGHATNVSGTALHVAAVEFKSYDVTGARVGTPGALIDHLDAGETWLFEAWIERSYDVSCVAFRRFSYLETPDSD